MDRIELNGSWAGVCFGAAGEKQFEFMGQVPGCVHTDLRGSRIPEDLFYRDNDRLCRWIEDCDWQYTKVFSLEEVPARARLVFEGLDTYADIFLNGEKVASTDNMFISHSFEAVEFLRQGENTLTVYFHSPIRRVEGLEKRGGAFTTERMHTRRIQCTYGWDWVARFVTCGIWREVYLDLTDGFALKNAYICTERIFDGEAQMVVEAEFENYDQGGFAEAEIFDPEGRCVYRHRWFVKESFLKEYIDLPQARLWYPVGYGKQPLYTLRLCGKEFVFGIRTVTIQQLPDVPGSAYHQKCLEIKDSTSGRIYDKNEEFSGFRLWVNDVPILCKGANWVPCEPFPSNETPEKITELLKLAVEAGVNMLRVWGGGIFEQAHFYDECDRLGILVTQDFLMACGHYPEEKAEFIAQLRREAEYAAYKLRNHPALMWWSGDNENAIMGDDEAEDYRGRRAIHEGILPVLGRLDPRRRFLRSSPYGGKLYASKTVGTTHNTQYLGDTTFPYILDTDMTDYKEFFAKLLARFIAEEPTCGAVSLPSLRKIMTEEDIFDRTEMWGYHTKDNPGLPFTLFGLLECFTKKILGEAWDGMERYFKLKYAQFEWLRVSMENIRRNRGFVNGIIYWMWNDCWPASSGWAFVDYYCLPKAAFYSFKRCAAPLLCSVTRSEEGYEVYLCNDGLQEREAELTLRWTKEGTVEEIARASVSVAAASAERVYVLPAEALPAGAVLLCDMVSGEERDRAFWKEGGLPLVATDRVKVIEHTAKSITVTADEYVHAVDLEGEFVFGDNDFSLLPGEERTIFFRLAVGTKDPSLSVRGYTIDFAKK